MDIDLNYIEKGAGPVLILLHGNGEDCSYFSEQTDHFSGSRRVIAVDTRGHGRSARGNAEFSIKQFAEDLRCFMDELNIERADILGFSDGGNIALTFALKYPERIDHLILNSANTDPSGVMRRYQLPIEIGYRIAKAFSGISGKAEKKAELLGLMVNEPHIGTEELSKLDMPVLVIAGTDDMIKESHTKLIASCIPGSELCFVKGSHFAARENPAEFNRAVDLFLDK